MFGKVLLKDMMPGGGGGWKFDLFMNKLNKVDFSLPVGPLSYANVHHECPRQDSGKGRS